MEKMPKILAAIFGWSIMILAIIGSLIFLLMFGSALYAQPGFDPRPKLKELEKSGAPYEMIVADSDSLAAWNSLLTFDSFDINVNQIIFGRGSGQQLENLVIGYNVGSNFNPASPLGIDNLAIGNNAGASTDDGYKNVFLGNYAGNQNTSGYLNLFVGVNAGRENLTGHSNVAIGAWAGYTNQYGIQNTFIGPSAGYSNEGSFNTFIGNAAGYYNGLGTRNFFLGNYAGFNNGGGSFNNFIGNTAGYNNTEGSYNVFIGDAAAYNNTTGENNIAIGANAGFTMTSQATNNTFIGFYAGYSTTTGDFNFFLGDEAGYLNTDGSNNVFIGKSAGAGNTTASGNTFIGNEAGVSTTTGGENIFIGGTAGASNTTGENNIFIGNAAGAGATTAIGQIAIGLNVMNASSYDYAIAIGPSVEVAEAGEIVIGNEAYNTTFRIGTDSFMVVPTGPDLIGGEAGGFRWNTDQTWLEYHNGTAWLEIAARDTVAQMISDSLTVLPGDNLGDHTATEDLDMGGFDILNADTITANVFVGVVGDDLGDHIMDQNLQTNGNWISGDANDAGIYINGTLDRVGINTNSPVGVLNILPSGGGSQDANIEIGSGRSADGNAYFDLVGDASSYSDFGVRFIRFGSTGESRFDHRGSSALTFKASDNGDIRFRRQSDDDVMFFEGTNGFVGIDTETPAYQLDIDGNNAVRFPSPTSTQRTALTGAAGLLTYDETVNEFFRHNGTSWDTLATRSWVNSQGAGGGDNLGDHTATENIQTAGYWISNDGDSEGLYVTTAGFVGIGTSSPDYPLTVQTTGSAAAFGFNRTDGTFFKGQAGLTGAEFFFEADKFVSFTPGDSLTDNTADFTNAFSLYGGSHASYPGQSVIGQQAPIGSAKFTVVGSTAIHSEGTLILDQKLQADDAGGLEFATDDGTSRMYVEDDGDVGIGISAPETTLHVEGTITVDQKIMADDAGGLEFAPDDGTTRLYLSDAGNIGIGKTPSYLVDVDDGGAVTNAIRLPHNTTAERNALTTATGLFIYNESDAVLEFFDGSNWLAVQTGTPTGDNWGSQVVQHDATLTGEGTAGTPLKVDTSVIATLVAVADTATAVRADDDWGSQAAVTDATLTGDGTSGTPLHVDTTVIATLWAVEDTASTLRTDLDPATWSSYAATQNINLSTFWFTGTDIPAKSSASTFTSGSVIFADANGELAQDNAGLFFNSTTNALGINTATPGYGLHNANTTALLVTGSNGLVRADENELFIDQASGPSATLWLVGSTDSIQLSYINGNLSFVNTASNANFNFSDGFGTGSSALYIDTDPGYVGINTATPSAALDVIGNVEISGTVQLASYSSGHLVVDGSGNLSVESIVGDGNGIYSGSGTLSSNRTITVDAGVDLNFTLATTADMYLGKSGDAFVSIRPQFQTVDITASTVGIINYDFASGDSHTINDVLTYDGSKFVSQAPSSGDGDGIYDGSGTLPASTTTATMDGSGGDFRMIFSNIGNIITLGDVSGGATYGGNYLQIASTSINVGPGYSFRTTATTGDTHSDGDILRYNSTYGSFTSERLSYANGYRASSFETCIAADLVTIPNSFTAVNFTHADYDGDGNKDGYQYTGTKTKLFKIDYNVLFRFVTSANAFRVSVGIYAGNSGSATLKNNSTNIGDHYNLKAGAADEYFTLTGTTTVSLSTNQYVYLYYTYVRNVGTTGSGYIDGVQLVISEIN